MPDTFDAYRDALVVETKTIWPDELADIGPQERCRVEHRMHAEPQSACELAYVRLHAGFCRQITVTAEDLQRVRSS